MSKLHLLESTPYPVTTRVIVHAPVPTGNNDVPDGGASWQAAGLASGDLGHTALTVGTGPGQITQAEADAIAAGSIVELEVQVRLDSGGTLPAQRLATLNKYAAAAVRDWEPVFKAKHRFFGFVQA